MTLSTLCLKKSYSWITQYLQIIDTYCNCNNFSHMCHPVTATVSCYSLLQKVCRTFHLTSRDIWFHDDALYKSTFYLLTYLPKNRQIVNGDLLNCAVPDSIDAFKHVITVLVNKAFTKDRTLIKKLFLLKGYSARWLIKEFPRK